jgi:acyl transferase domain-containing protein/NAD(P)H-dependent flavin oxidoreductase YrpB (nitropropane dioxygenase family)/NAD(P)-dependent dehydrogenase (short-subunit alcohol dehydrogenase family)
MLGRLFTCLTLTPGELATPGLAIAAARAGGVGILDATRCSTGELPALEALVGELMSGTPADSAIGLRLGLAQLRRAKPLLSALQSRAHVLIVRGRPGATSALDGLAGDGRTLLAEIDSVEAAAEWQAAWPDIGGFVVNGSEAGGWSSASGGFVLIQALLGAGIGPLYLRGGIGEHGAAACRTAGCAGVVLDDQVLLMPEADLPTHWRAHLERAEAHDAVLLGEHLDLRCRVLGQPAFPRVKELAAREAALEIADEPLAKRQRAWRAAVEAVLRFGPPESCVWPVGQAIGLAAGYRARYRTTGRLVQALLRTSETSIELASRVRPLAEGGPLATAQRTAFPIVQGPMTRVSDTPGFAAAVARAGALPMLALGVMDGAQSHALLSATRTELGDRPWGAGILGFMDPEVRKAQLAAVRAVKPPFAVVAGGRADVAEELEAAGIATYLHVPSVDLLRSVIRRGLRRFVFEGRECGGHVGPLGSATLWEVMVQALLADLTDKTAGEYQLLFAGGVHDGRSAAMVAGLAAPLAALGAKIGVLMGTAYLFTGECVETGAVGPVFQQEALTCERTVLVESAPGHANRCVDTSFCRDFGARRRELRRRKATLDEQRDALDDLLLGRLRMASKGLWREGGGALVGIDAARQQREGMFMIGEAATLRSARTTLAQLHLDVSHGAEECLERAAASLPRPAPRPAAPVDVAIVGISLALPGAASLQGFWANLQRKEPAISEIPAQRWDWRPYFDPTGKAPDSMVSRWGGFIDPLRFDPVAFGIPPSSLEHISVAQPMVLELTRRAIADAGYELGDLDRENAAVILGAGDPAGVSGKVLSFRALMPALLGGLPDGLETLPGWSEDSLPGHITNVVAGRVANRFDFGGVNFTVDAACASSLAALEAACGELASRRANLVIAGGVEIWQIPEAYVSFTKTGALSPRGQSRPFDASADGIVLGEGAVVLVLKRLADAERDGDRIYAVIRSISGSSDGKALSMTAPRPIGQLRAMRRAYEAAGFSPATLGFYEAHATGTPVGDSAELSSVTTLLAGAGAPARSCVAGSVKAHIGHTGSTAGSASLVKAALALYHRTLPPQVGVNAPADALAGPDCPLFLLDEPRPWLARPGAPRRAGVSAFGFGGTNFHAVLEEHRNATRQGVLGGEIWPAELVVLAGRDRAGLDAAVKRVVTLLDREDPPSLREIAHVCARAFGSPPPGAHVATIVARDTAECRFALTRLTTMLASEGTDPGDLRTRYGILPVAAPLVALLFSGQGSPYPNMAREAAVHIPEFREALERADRLLADDIPGPLSAIIYPPRAFSDAEREAQQARLRDTAVAQPAIGALSIGFLGLLGRLGVSPAMVAGHSYGEWVALHAAGVFDAEDLLRHSARRGKLMASVSDEGAMAAVIAPRELVERQLPKDGRTVVANHNAPSQAVISGPSAAIEAVIAEFGRQGVRALRLPVAGAFHSPLMAEAQAELGAYIDGLSLKPPALPVYGNADAAVYEPRRLAARLKSHLLSPVEFCAQVKAMHAAGARAFVEVGPGSVLTNLVNEILPAGSRLAVALDGSMGSLAGLLQSLAALWRAGVRIDLPRLFDRRVDPALDLDRLAAAPAATGGWLLDGQSIWRVDGPEPAPLPRATGGFGAAQPASSGALEAYAAYQQTMRDFVATQERVLMRLLGGSDHVAAGDFQMPAPVPAPPPIAAVREVPARPPLPPPEPIVASTVPADTDLDRDGIAALIVELAAKRTGYPPELLGSQQDVEAELGIGSIKRLEILEALGQRLPPRIAQRLKAAMDRVARLKTFAEWAEILGTPNGDATDGAAAPAPASAELLAEAPAWRLDCPRFLMRAERRPLETAPPGAGIGPVVITEDALGIAAEVERLLRERSIASAILPRGCLTDGGLAAAVDKARRAAGSFRAVLHLAGMEARAMPTEIADWRGCTERHAKGLLRLLRSLAEDIGGAAPARVISASLLGGYFGRDRAAAPGLPTAGAAVGALRSLELEMPGVRCKAIDFDRDRPSGEIAAILVQELLAAADALEIGYRRGERSVFVPEPAPQLEPDPSTAEIPGDSIVLATGGARGITAELLRNVVKPGMTVIVVGRSALDMNAALVEPADPAVLRAELIERSRANGAQGRPAEIEQAVAAEMHRREAARTVASLHALGATVEYHAVDVCDVDRFTALIADIYKRHGRIDVVLHGAGVIEDKALIDKTDASIDRVFDTKVDSTFALYRALDRSSLRAIVLFASLAGRFGNRGQMDYAAANEVINRLAWRMAVEWPQVRVLSINWGPWARIGMAVDTLGTLRRRLAPIEPEAGCAFLRAELARGRSDEVEILAGDIAMSVPERPVGGAPGIERREAGELVGSVGDS